MEKLETQIDKEKVRERIDNFIGNGDRTNFYVRAPSRELIERVLYSREVLDDKYKPIFAPKVLLSKPSDYPVAKANININKVLFRADYQIAKIGIGAEKLAFMFKAWNQARYYENHPEKKFGILEKLFFPPFWGKTLQQFWDKVFVTQLQRAYEWLQEDNPLEQCDLKNRYAINGLNLLCEYNQWPEHTQKAPLDEFVAEQIKGIPEKIIEKVVRTELDFKWVYGEKIVDMDCTLGELYH